MSKSQRLILCMSSALSAALLLSGCMHQNVKQPGSYQTEGGAGTVTDQLIKQQKKLAETRDPFTIQIPNPNPESGDPNRLQPQAPSPNSSLALGQSQAQPPVTQVPSAAASQPPVPKSKAKQQQQQAPKPKQPQKSRTTALQQSNAKKQLTLSQLIKKYPDLLLLHGPTGSNKVALTFDDAPDTKYTPQVLDILKKYNVKATFFVVGQLVERYPNVVKRMTREGHVVGNHSYNHSLLTRLSDEQFQSQINKTQNLLKSTIGYTPRLIRPPYGEITESQLLWATSHHFIIVNWNVDSKDWKQLSQAQVTSNVLNHARSGSIILQHSGGGPGQNLSGTVDALPTIIESLQSKGYTLVTLPELLKVSKQF